MKISMIQKLNYENLLLIYQSYQGYSPSYALFLQYIEQLSSVITFQHYLVFKIATMRKKILFKLYTGYTYFVTNAYKMKFQSWFSDED